jgi:hypothetical protein
MAETRRVVSFEKGMGGSVYESPAPKADAPSDREGISFDCAGVRPQQRTDGRSRFVPENTCERLGFCGWLQERTMHAGHSSEKRSQLPQTF